VKGFNASPLLHKIALPSFDTQKDLPMSKAVPAPKPPQVIPQRANELRPDMSSQATSTTRDTPPGAYVLLHPASGCMYVGSTAKIAKRQNEHVSRLKRGMHEIPELQKLYDQSPEISWHLHPTENRKAAYAMEQELVNRLLPTGALLNKIETIRLPGPLVPKIRKASAPRTEEHKTRLAQARTGLELSPQWRQRISEAGKRVVLSEDAKARVLAARRQHTLDIQVPVAIDGTTYPSTQHAAEVLGLPYQKVFYRTRSKLPKWAGYQLPDNPQESNT
jgi:hypothetical protein